MWFEPLPDQCPPVDASPPNGTFYRLAEDSLPKCSDFWSHRKLWPSKKFNTTECLAMSLSVYTDPAQLEALKLMKPHAKKAIVAVNLTSSAGLVKKTFGPHHHSWWRNADFDLLKHAVAP